ncbi:MAG: hypothetical protein K2N01_09085 [Lachnospiraceae bacterium]|nr:hypothetical protein [Lachnospiraceae bacterium]
MCHYLKNKFVTGIALLLALSLTACQWQFRGSALATPPKQGNSMDIPDESSTGTASDDLVLVYTGIESEIIECDAEYPQYSELKAYLDEKQFALLKNAHKGSAVLFEGREALEYVEDWDWDLVRPLHNSTYYDCGYGKIDYNNDGTAEIIYRAINGSKQIAATVYEPDNAAEQIESEYNLVDIFSDEALPDSTLQQLWFEKIGDDIVTFRLLRKGNSEKFIVCSDIVKGNDAETTCFRLETRNLTVTTKQADSLEQDIFQDRILDLTKGDGEVFEALRREQLIAYQSDRQINSGVETTELPKGLLDILKEVLAESQCYGGAWNIEERLSAYEDKKHQLTLEQVQTYLGEAFSDHYDAGDISCAYLVDLDKNGNEKLVLFYDSGGSGGFADVDIWQKQEDGTTEQLYNIPEFRGYAALLDYDNTYYFVVRQYNFYTRETEGFHILTAGANGTLQQYLLGLENKENQKAWIETYHDKELDISLEQKLTDYIEKIKTELEEKTVSSADYQLMDGNAETPYQESDITFSLDAFSIDSYEEQSCRIVDFDNDGRMECLKKDIWYPSSLNTTLGLTVDFYKEYDSYVHKTEICFPCFSNSYSRYAYTDGVGTIVNSEEIFEKEPVQIWFEEFDQKVYTFYMNRIWGSSDYLLEVSLIEGEELHPLLQYLLIADKEYTFGQVEP